MSDDRFRLYHAADLGPVLEDMARQAANLLDGTPTVLLGMLRRGAPLADMLFERLRPRAPTCGGWTSRSSAMPTRWSCCTRTRPWKRRRTPNCRAGG